MTGFPHLQGHLQASQKSQPGAGASWAHRYVQNSSWCTNQATGKRGLEQLIQYKRPESCCSLCQDLQL